MASSARWSLETVVAGHADSKGKHRAWMGNDAMKKAVAGVFAKQ
jgi:hypothetical protein